MCPQRGCRVPLGMSAVWVPVPYGVACLFVLDPLVARISFHHRFFFTNPDRLSYHLIQPSPWLRPRVSLSVCLFCQVGEAVGARGASGGGPSGCALLDTGFLVRAHWSLFSFLFGGASSEVRRCNCSVVYLILSRCVRLFYQKSIYLSKIR